MRVIRTRQNAENVTDMVAMQRSVFNLENRQQAVIVQKRKMIQIIFTIVTVVFVQLVNGQDACTTAQTNLAANTECVTAIAYGTDTICMETCRNFTNAIISNCDTGVSRTSFMHAVLFIC